MSPRPSTTCARVIDEMLVAKYIPENAYPEQWDVPGLKDELKRVLNIDLPIEEWAKEEGIADEEMLVAHRAQGRRAHGRQGRAIRRRRHALCREIDPAADPRSSLARASRDARASAPGGRPARLCPARSAQRIQVRSLPAVREPDHQSARGGDRPADAGRGRAGAAAGRAEQSCLTWKRTRSIRTPAKIRWRWPR